MKKDRNRKNQNTKAFAAAAVLGVGAVAAASFAADSRTMRANNAARNVFMVRFFR